MDTHSSHSSEEEQEAMPFNNGYDLQSERELWLSEEDEETDDTEETEEYDEDDDETGESYDEAGELEMPQIQEDKEKPEPEPEEVLTKEETNTIKDTFEKLKDKKANAFQAEMLGAVLQSIGMTPTLNELQQYREKFDKKDSGWLTIDQVLKAAAIQRTSAEPITIEQAEEAFKYLILKYPTTQKLISELLTIGESLTLTEASIMRKVADPTATGLFDLEKLLGTIDPRRRKKNKRKGAGKKGKKGK